MQCPTCGEKHDLTAMEPAFRFPDAYIGLPASEREVKASVAPGGDACVVFTIPGAPPTGYLRAVLPVPIRGDSLCNWGVWIELAPADMLRVADRWDVSDQSRDAPIPGPACSGPTRWRRSRTSGRMGPCSTSFGIASGPLANAEASMTSDLSRADRMGIASPHLQGMQVQRNATTECWRRLRVASRRSRLAHSLLSVTTPHDRASRDQRPHT